MAGNSVSIWLLPDLDPLCNITVFESHSPLLDSSPLILRNQESEDLNFLKDFHTYNFADF